MEANCQIKPKFQTKPVFQNPVDHESISSQLILFQSSQHSRPSQGQCFKSSVQSPCCSRTRVIQKCSRPSQFSKSVIVPRPYSVPQSVLQLSALGQAVHQTKSALGARFSKETASRARHWSGLILYLYICYLLGIKKLLNLTQ